MEPETITVTGQNPVCISFNAPVKAGTASPLMGAFASAINDGHDEIHFFLSTLGGSVADGITLYNFIRSLPAKVIVYNTGSVNSTGNIIYQAGSRRVCAAVASFMFHGVGFDVQNARLEMKQLKERMDNLTNDQSMVADILVRHTELGTDDVNQLFLEMAFVNAQEALKRGITDEIRDFRLPKGMRILQLVFQG